jgi:hypothetical protein
VTSILKMEKTYPSENWYPPTTLQIYHSSLDNTVCYCCFCFVALGGGCGHDGFTVVGVIIIIIFPVTC